MMFTLDMMLSIMMVLLSIAFFTLMERKIMGISHYRKGPNKVAMMGITQPIADAMKLMTKEFHKLSAYKMMMFMAGPCLSLVLMVLCWGWFNFYYQTTMSSMKMFMILATMSMSIYGFLLMSWGSSSKYAMIGGHRAIAQTISYEVTLFLFILVCCYMSKSYSFFTIKFMQQGMWVMLFSLPLFMMWGVLCLAESNRTPFDMAEGESEIVSGFNIEYMGGLFALIFISEYGMIMFLSFMTSLLIMGETMTMMKTFMISFMFVWVRCTLPRMRYDKLMMLTWKIALPYSILMCIITMMTFSI